MTSAKSDRLLRRGEVELKCGLARTSIYRLMRAGTFPAPLKVGPRAVRWPESEIERWVSERPVSSVMYLKFVGKSGPRWPGSGRRSWSRQRAWGLRW